MNPKDREILLKILKHANHVVSYTARYESLAAFETDEMCVETTVFNLMQMGELAKTSLSEELKREVTGVPWHQIYGLRNRIVHGYEGVNMRIVWDTARHDIPELCNTLTELTKEA